MAKYKHIPTGDIYEKKIIGAAYEQRYGFVCRCIEIHPLIVESPNSKDWEKIEPEEKEYLIKSYRSKSGAIAILRDDEQWIIPAYNSKISHDLDSEFSEIYSLKRLSDGEVFEVGNLITDRGGNGQIKILGFELSSCKQMAVRMDGGCWPLNYIEHAPKRTPLFRSEDGVYIYEEVNYWPVSKITFKISGPFQVSKNGRVFNDEDSLIFSTKEAAQEYVEDNKPIFNAKDMQIAWAKNCTWQEIGKEARKRCGFDNLTPCQSHSIEQEREEKI